MIEEESRKRHLTEKQKRVLSQALWDLNLSPDDFLEIIEGRSSRRWPERGFCVARLLESVNWLKIVEIIDPRVLCGAWETARRYVRMNEIKEGMDFACRVLR